MKPWLGALVLVSLCAVPLGAEDGVEVVEDREPVDGGEASQVPAAEGEPDAATVDAAAGEGEGIPVRDGDGEADHRVLVEEARKLAAAGQRSRALELLENYLFVHGDDAEAKALALSLRIAERKAEMRAILTQQAEEKGMVLGDPGYEEAKAKAPIHIARQLDLVEFLIQEQRYTKAVQMCQRIKEQHGEHEATLTLLDRLLSHLVDLERRRLERDRAIRRGEVVNDVIERGTVPRDKRPIPRTVLIFDEDIQELEKERLLQQLRIKLGRIDYKEAQLGDILKDLFAAAGLNYIIRDDAIGQETLTISLVDETVEHVLEVIQRMVPVTFNYRGGSVYVTSADSPILVTEIIRLQSGLTDVLAQAQLQGGDGGGDDGEPPLTPFGDGGDGDDGEAASDLERFLAAAVGDEGRLIQWPPDSAYYLDRKTNTLYVRSSPAAIAELKRLLHGLDFNNVQVLIEARFVLVEDRALDELGVNWAMLGQEEGSGDRQFFFGGAQENSTNPLGANPAGLASQLTTSQPGIRLGAIGIGEDLLPNFSVTLDALESRGQANVFSEPKILTLNNATGIIAFQNDIAYVAGFTNQAVGNQDVEVDDGAVVSSQQNVLVPDFEIEQEEIRLEVRPSVARNSDIITLHIHPLVREFIGLAGDTDFANVPDETAVLGNTPVQQPQFQRRELATTLHIQNGQTIVLGGLVEEDDNRSRSGIPYLSRIPGAGLLFGSRSKELRRAKLLIFVTCNIIDPSGAEFSQEVRHLRDTARISLTDEARAVERAREELEAEMAAKRAEERAAAEGDDGSSGVPNPRSQFGGSRRK